MVFHAQTQRNGAAQDGEDAYYLDDAGVHYHVMDIQVPAHQQRFIRHAYMIDTNHCMAGNQLFAFSIIRVHGVPHVDGHYSRVNNFVHMNVYQILENMGSLHMRTDTMPEMAFQQQGYGNPAIQFIENYTATEVP